MRGSGRAQTRRNSCTLARTAGDDADGECMQGESVLQRALSTVLVRVVPAW